MVVDVDHRCSMKRSSLYVTTVARKSSGHFETQVMRMAVQIHGNHGNSDGEIKRVFDVNSSRAAGRRRLLETYRLKTFLHLVVWLVGERVLILCLDKWP